MFTFFMNLDIKRFIPRIISKIKAKEEVIDILKSLVEQYIESNVRNFNDKGENTESNYQVYCQFATNYGFGVLNNQKANKDLWCA